MPKIYLTVEMVEFLAEEKYIDDLNKIPKSLWTTKFLESYFSYALKDDLIYYIKERIESLKNEVKELKNHKEKIEELEARRIKAQVVKETEEQKERNKRIFRGKKRNREEEKNGGDRAYRRLAGECAYCRCR